jgi:hypothetical protein
MKKYFDILLIAAIIIFPVLLFSQPDVYKYIGKSPSQLTKALGKPVYVDKSNSSMVMIFYKSPTLSRSFVADGNGIYQAEATQSFESENSCKATVSEFISDLNAQGFSVDTVSVSEFNCGKPGVTCTLNYGFNDLTKKYSIYVAAHRKEK